MRPNNFPVISIFDPALDTEAMSFDVMGEYVKNRDIKVLQPYLQPGQRPTIYNIRAVPHGLWESFVGSAGANEELRFRYAFMCGVDSVENLVGNDGVALPLWKPTKSMVGSNEPVLSEEECNKRFDPIEVHEIGSVIHKHSFLGLKRKATWHLPSLLFEPLGQLRFRPAASSQSTAMLTSSSPSDGAGHRTTETENPAV